MNNPYHLSAARRAAVYAVIGKVGSQLLIGATLFIAAAAIPTAAFGQYSAMVSMATIVGTALSLGIGNTVQRFLPEYVSSGEYILAHRMVRLSLFFRFLSTSIIAIGAAVLWGSISSSLKLPGTWIIYAASASIVVSALQMRLLNIIQNSLFQQKSSTLAQFAFAAVKFLALLPVSRLPVDPLIYICAIEIIATLISVSISYTALHSFFSENEVGRERFDQDEVRRILRYGLFYNFNDLGVMALGRDIDNIFIAALISPTALASYAFFGRLADFVQKASPVNVLVDVIRPAIFAGYRDATQQELIDRFSLLLKISFITSICSGVALVAMLELITKLVGADYRASLATGYIIVAFAAFYVLNIPIGIAAQMRENGWPVLISKVFAVFSIAGNFWVAPRFGIAGVAVLTGVTTLAKDLFVWLFVTDVVRFVNPRRTLFALTVLVLPPVALRWGLGAQLNLGVLSVGSAILVLALTPIAFRLAIASPGERALLQAAGGRRAQFLMAILFQGKLGK